MMPFGLKNALAIFPKVVIAVFKEFIHKFLEVYFDHWTIFGLMNKHVGALRLRDLTVTLARTRGR